MTTTRNKAVGRAAHAARTKRHSQRDPLPTKALGNPTAEALADEHSKRKAAKAKAGQPAAASEPTEQPAVATVTPNASQDVALAARVKELRDGGSIWKEIAATLGLGEGKTGTSRCRRLYKVAAGEKAPSRVKGTTGSRRRRSGRMATDGETTARGPLAPSMPLYDLTATSGKGKKKRTYRTEGLGEQQVRSLTAVYEGDGMSVTTVRHGAAS